MFNTKIIRPCIRGLQVFQKSGCPEKCWDRVNGKGCPAWKEYTIVNEKGKPIILKDCIDGLTEHWSFEALKLIEGTQVATESLRNGMCEEIDGKVYPKPDQIMLSFMNILNNKLITK